MAWSQPGHDAMLGLFCAWASECWDDIFAGELGKSIENFNEFKAAA